MPERRDGQTTLAMNQPTRRTVLCALLAATALHGAGAATVDAAGFVDQLGQRTIAALDRLGGDRQHGGRRSPLCSTRRSTSP